MAETRHADWRDYDDDPSFGPIHHEPRLDPGDVVHVRTANPAVRVRLLQNISRRGFSIVTNAPLAPATTAYFEFSTSTGLLVTVPATAIYSRPLDEDAAFHLSGWQFSSEPEEQDAVAAIFEFLLARLAID